MRRLRQQRQKGRRYKKRRKSRLLQVRHQWKEVRRKRQQQKRSKTMTRQMRRRWIFQGIARTGTDGNAHHVEEKWQEAIIAGRETTIIG